jgi:thiol:disulfide interchange protein DsbA
MISIRKLLTLAAAALAFGAASATAQMGGAPMPEFTLLNPPQPIEGGGKIEVIEFFWYGCPHCSRLEPFIQKWEKTLPKDVVFKRVHALPGDSWIQTATIFYTLESMGLLEKLHTRIFAAIHDDNVILTNKATRDQWLAKNGVDMGKFTDVEKSFAVQTKLNRARQMTASYKVDGVPMLFVNGKYVTSNTHAGGDTGRIMVIVDRLIDRARKETVASK